MASMSKAVNATDYDMIPAFVPKGKDLVFAVIETPAGIRHKFRIRAEIWDHAPKDDVGRRVDVAV